MELNIERFSPTRAELEEIADAAAQITLENPLDKQAVMIVHDMRMGLRKARGAITKRGKEMREDAVKFQKAVIVKENELIAIIEPEEERLQRLEEDALVVQEREARREFLPRRKERLDALKDGVQVSDEELLDLDGTAFEGYFNRRLAEKNEADRQKISAEQKKIDNEKAALTRQQDLAEVYVARVIGCCGEERGRKEAAEKAEREAKEKADKEARERIAAAAEADRKRLQLEQDARYQAFLKEHSYNPDDFYTTQEIGGIITLWKKVATFNPNK